MHGPRLTSWKILHTQISSLCSQITFLDDAVLSVKGGSTKMFDRHGGAGGVIQIIGSCGEIRYGSSMNTMKGKFTGCQGIKSAEDGFMIIAGIPKGEFAPAVVYKPTVVLISPPPEVDQTQSTMLPQKILKFRSPEMPFPEAISSSYLIQVMIFYRKSYNSIPKLPKCSNTYFGFYYSSMVVFWLGGQLPPLPPPPPPPPLATAMPSHL